jgi:hypothetical protein
MRLVSNVIKAYLDANAKTIINDVKGKVTFASHEFISALQKNPSGKAEYDRWLSRYSKNSSQNVNSQIARYLSEKETDLKIKNLNRRVRTSNVQGTKSISQLWEKL